LILTVKIPSRFDVTVRAKANAVLAPASWVREIPLVRVVGTQQKIANPVTSSLGTKFRRKTGTAIKGVMNKIETCSGTTDHHSRVLLLCTSTQ
jgi:hypothetical protein